MTVLNVAAALTALGGSVPVSSGRITVEYLRSGAPAARVDGATVTLPAPVVADIVDGSPAVPLDVPPTDGTCYARVWIECRAPRDAGFLELAAVAIPATGPVDIADLVAVDPASYEPITTVVTAWELAVAEVADMRMEVVLESGRAVGAAMDAGSYAEATEFDANRAGASAFQAGQSAASALGHKNDAKGSADAAAGSATAAQTARTGAETARAGAEAAQTAAGTARTGAETAQTGAVTARTGAETAKTGAETARTGAEQARDLALAGQFLGSALTSATDLNAVTTPGVYRCPSGAFATSANNYPAVGVAGVLTVTQWGGSGQVVQRYTPYPSTGTPNIIIGEWVRAYRGSAFSAWRFMASQRINNPAGQPGVEPFTFDDTSNRELALTPASIELGTVDLNAVTLAGSYRQRTPAEATVARNYPIGNVRVVLEVLAIETNLIEQRLTIVQGHASAMRGHYVRRNNYGTWEAWSFFASQRVDQTAGRAIYTWDDVNGREQRIYGDTGWREIGSLVANGWTSSSARLRRMGDRVEVALFGVDPAAATSDLILNLPSGFRPGSGYIGTMQLYVRYGSIVNWVRLTTSGDLNGNRGQGVIAPASADVVSFSTTDPWPTVLPGTAVGSIPS